MSEAILIRAIRSKFRPTMIDLCKIDEGGNVEVWGTLHKDMFDGPIYQKLTARQPVMLEIRMAGEGE